MTMRKIFLAATFVALCCVLVVMNRGTDMNKYQPKSNRISASAAREKMLANSSVIIIDVRSSREFATGKIPGAVLLPDNKIREQAHLVIPNKNSLVLVYCRSGVRSADATYALISMGYTNVYDFGGILDWPYDIVR
jgi:rhodanese-related sulfurtransferase